MAGYKGEGWGHIEGEEGSWEGQGRKGAGIGGRGKGEVGKKGKGRQK